MRKPPADLNLLAMCDLEVRKSIVGSHVLGKPWRAGGSLADFLDSLPNVLAAQELRATADAVIRARREGRPVILAMGAHVIKVGLSPLLIDAMERGIITALVLNGACLIHDVELALAGQTSEDVASALADGSFGTARQTGMFINSAVAKAGGRGLGQAVGEALLEKETPHAEISLLAAGARLELPVLVHVCVGADIIHMHPSFDGGATGQASHVDFRHLVSEVGDLSGGVYFNVGSAVVLPEVFLKALSAARNLHGPVKDFTTVNMDMIRHYRPMTNVVLRPVLPGGKGITLIGHHEINLPLLLAMVGEGLEKAS